ncbi:RagB/SusD family nutrient uptake outer membrane protein [Arachidicoccus ginsenosidivorans]|uniref:hypothetical protein n=1 Tax=Arachidicoccus ginsenosidivorans TaxID=496057 RepID=UPI001CEF71F7|nr:hypothetical protein [Arachidicoccus ginsenosidivorans]
MRSFGEVPLKLDPTSNDDQIVQMAKSSQADVLQQIVKDLKDAEPLTLTTYGNQASDKGRITRYTVDAIEADVYLWMENYPDAVTACDKIINAKNLALLPAALPGLPPYLETEILQKAFLKFSLTSKNSTIFIICLGHHPRSLLLPTR